MPVSKVYDAVKTPLSVKSRNFPLSALRALTLTQAPRHHCIKALAAFAAGEHHRSRHLKIKNEICYE